MPAMGMEDVQMKMEDNGAMEMEMALEQGEPAWPEIACPYCYEYYDVVSLSVHLEEDHPYERHAEVSQLAGIDFSVYIFLEPDSIYLYLSL